MGCTKTGWRSTVRISSRGRKKPWACTSFTLRWTDGMGFGLVSFRVFVPEHVVYPEGPSRNHVDHPQEVWIRRQPRADWRLSLSWVRFRILSHFIFVPSYCSTLNPKVWKRTLVSLRLFSCRLPCLCLQMYCDFLFLPCQTESSQRLHHRAQSSRSAVSAAALWQVRRGESRSVPRLFVDECWLLSTRMRWWLLFWQSDFLCRRTKTRPCRPPSSRTSSACVPTCRGAPRSTWPSLPRGRATSPTSATAASGRTCLTPLASTLMR